MKRFLLLVLVATLLSGGMAMEQNRKKGKRPSTRKARTENVQKKTDIVNRVFPVESELAQLRAGSSKNYREILQSVLQKNDNNANKRESQRYRCIVDNADMLFLF